MMSDKCNLLFDELKMWNDEQCMMHEFIECLKYWVKDLNKGEVKICLIDLSELDCNFLKEDLYIAYDDCSGHDIEIVSTYDFINSIQTIYNERSDDLEPESYWVKALTDILYDGVVRC